MPALRLAWKELAEQSVAGLSTPLGQLIDALTDLAHSLTRDDRAGTR